MMLRRTMSPNGTKRRAGERQKKRLTALYQAGVAQVAASGKKPPQSFIGSAGEEDEEAAN
jgi:hypothetical protein